MAQQLLCTILGERHDYSLGANCRLIQGPSLNMELELSPQARPPAWPYGEVSHLVVNPHKVSARPGSSTLRPWRFVFGE
jgi:hypothetical protein